MADSFAGARPRPSFLEPRRLLGVDRPNRPTPAWSAKASPEGNGWRSSWSLAFDLPHVERRPCATSVSGAQALWLPRRSRRGARPETFLIGREFAHVHPTLDGSMQMMLPPEAVEELVGRAGTAQFEWYAHARFALEAGVGPEIVSAKAEGRRPESLSPGRAAVHDFCIELLDQGRVSDNTFRRALDHLDRRSVMDLVGLCGYYTLIAMVLNVAEVPIPDDATPLGQPWMRPA